MIEQSRSLRNWQELGAAGVPETLRSRPRLPGPPQLAAMTAYDTSRKCQLPRVMTACRAKADSGKPPHHDVPITPPARPRTTAGRRRRRWRSAAPRARSRRAGPCRKISDSGRERRLPSAAGRRFSQVIVCARPHSAFSSAVIRSAGPDHPRARWVCLSAGLDVGLGTCRRAFARKRRA